MSDRKDLDASASMKFLMLWNLYIVLLLVAGILTMMGMARRRKRQYRRRGGRRASGRYIKGNVDENLALDTLAGRTLIGAAFDEVVVERTLISSLVATYSLADFTNAAGDGPITVGIAHNDYSDAEIEEVIESVTSWDEGDLVGKEVANRKVRKIGTFQSDEVGVLGIDVLNDGMPIKSKLNWILTTGDTLRLWAYNEGTSALATGSTIKCQGHANLWPR